MKPPHIVEITGIERTQGHLEADRLEAIRRDIHTRGYAVVSGLIPLSTCHLLAGAIVEDAEQVRSTGELTPHEQRTAPGHLQLGLRRHAPWVSADLVANPLIESVVAAVLGPGAWLGFYNGNVNCPGSGTQSLHFDRPYSWKTPEQAAADGQPWPLPTTTLSCSVALTDITAATGATRIIPGSHHETAVTGWKPGERPGDHPEVLSRWTQAGRMEIPAGGVCFRDPRMWHHGVPNTSSMVRPMIALTYHSARAKHWRGLLLHDMRRQDLARCEADPSLRVLDNGDLGDGRLVFHASARDAFEVTTSDVVNRNARFVDDPWVVDHLHDAHLPGGARVTGPE